MKETQKKLGFDNIKDEEIIDNELMENDKVMEMTFVNSTKKNKKEKQNKEEKVDPNNNVQQVSSMTQQMGFIPNGFVFPQQMQGMNFQNGVFVPVMMNQNQMQKPSYMYQEQISNVKDIFGNKIVAYKEFYSKDDRTYAQIRMSSKLKHLLNDLAKSDKNNRKTIADFTTSVLIVGLETLGFLKEENKEKENIN